MSPSTAIAFSILDASEMVKSATWRKPENLLKIISRLGPAKLGQREVESVLSAPVGELKQALSAGFRSGNFEMGDITHPLSGTALKSFEKLPGAKPQAINMRGKPIDPNFGWRADVDLPSAVGDQHFANKPSLAGVYADKFSVPYHWSKVKEFGNHFGFMQRAKLPENTDWRIHTGSGSKAPAHPNPLPDVAFGKQYLEAEVPAASTSVNKLFLMPHKWDWTPLGKLPAVDVTQTPRDVLSRAVASYRKRLPGGDYTGDYFKK